MIFLVDELSDLHTFRFHERAARSLAAYHPEHIYFFADLTPPVEEKPVKCTCEYRIEPALMQPSDGPTMYGRLVRVYACPAQTHQVRVSNP